MGIEHSRLLSRPLHIHWAGWETTTYQLQKCGWKLSAEQDFRSGRMRIAMKHRHGMEAITEYVPFDYERAAMLHGPMDRDYVSGITLGVQVAIGNQVMIHHGSIDSLWAPIDAEPRYITEQITKLEDLAHFAGPLIRTNEIVVPEESVPELLDKILKMQQPAKLERIREEIRGEKRVEQKFHAQIISLAERRIA